ncbi:MAG: kynureninase [Xanthomonadales bacterium]|nr:kynureninase [Xanthomonadales bacterium]
MTSQATGQARARELDAQDPLAHFRDEFWIPPHADQGEQRYFCGNSLGLQPRRLSAFIEEELSHWQTLGVAGHFTGRRPWMSYHESLREPLADLVGAKPAEVVAMNALTVNLHLLMVSFFQPAGARNRIVIERQPFPSDRYAVESQLRYHGLNPDECLIELGADSDERLVGEAELEAYLAAEGDRVALVLWPGVQYATGQRYDLARVAQAAQAAGAMVGFDLAHAVGNVPVDLHASGADFAAWCSYKYMNSGAGSVAGAFVHERHHGREDLPRLHGWWGAHPDSRFLMAPEFVPAPGADAWLQSNSPILSMAPLRVSLDLFREAGFDRLREKSLAMTAYLESLLTEELGDWVSILTPSDPEQRGCQLSFTLRAGAEQGRALFEHLIAEGYIGDWREPDIIRVAPVPLYNRYQDCLDLVNEIKVWRDRR